MLPKPAFEDEEWPSGIVSRGRAPANFHHELSPWFEDDAVSVAAPPESMLRELKAIDATDARPEPPESHRRGVVSAPAGARDERATARIPFLIF